MILYVCKKVCFRLFGNDRHTNGLRVGPDKNGTIATKGESIDGRNILVTHHRTYVIYRVSLQNSKKFGSRTAKKMI